MPVDAWYNSGMKNISLYTSIVISIFWALLLYYFGRMEIILVALLAFIVWPIMLLTNIVWYVKTPKENIARAQKILFIFNICATVLVLLAFYHSETN